MSERKKGVLVLEDPAHPEGLVFEGELIGAPISREILLKSNRDREGGFGEVVFNTAMTGYQEILTDPSYYGQMVVMTYPHIGNTGVNFEDPESAHPWASGLIVHEFSDRPSNWRSQGTLDHYLKEHGIPGLTGIDTRALTRYLRSRGVLRGVILPADELKYAMPLLKELPQFEGRDLISEVTTKEAYHWPDPACRDATPPFKKLYKVVTVDFGVKWNSLRSLSDRGCDVTVVPAQTTAAEILKMKPDGVFLSNGPGDPAAAPYAAEMARGLLGRVPLFGICMGHQILGIALGAKTFKLKFGHRGANQPVFNQWHKQVEISSQNHGYAVDPTTLPPEAEVSHIHLNDQTCAGMVVRTKRAFSVQYHPESCPGPHDSQNLFDVFIEMMKESRDTQKSVH